MTSCTPTTWRARSAFPNRDFDILIAAGNVPFGIWSDGVTMWVADDFDAKLYAYDTETKARVPGRDFNTLIAAGNRRDLTASGPTARPCGSPTRLMASCTPTTCRCRTTPTCGASPWTASRVAGFDPAETAYSHRVDETATQVTVAAEARQLLAEVTAVTPPDADPNTDGHQVDFPENAREVAVTVTVTAQDGTATKTYTVTVLRGTGPPYGWKVEDDFNTLQCRRELPSPGYLVRRRDHVGLRFR